MAIDLSGLIVPKRVPTKIGDLLLDALIREQEMLSNQISKFPIEDGSNAADNIILDPDRLIIEGMVSNSPIKVAGLFGRDAENKISANSNSIGSDLTFAEQAWSYLRQLREDRVLVKISTKRRIYEDMGIVSIERTLTREIGDALSFVATFQKVRKVRLLFVLTQQKKVKLDKSKAKLDGGKNAAPDAPAAAAKPVSITHALFHGGK